MTVKSMSFSADKAIGDGQELWNLEMVLTTTAISTTKEVDKP